ncbi:aldo/keto reductase [candidate division KSB1 bacterium]|nr:MAG: aldo/keto reductase [candidate division KSB1 bacterium]
MPQTFSESVLGKTGIPVHRLGLSGTYWPGKKTIYHALDAGINVFFCYGFDGQMVRVLRDVSQTRREDLVIVTGAYNLIWGYPNLRRTLEKRLRQLGTDYIDAFLFLGVMKPKQMPDKVVEELCRFREEGKVRGIGLSCHDRKFAGKLAAEGKLDTFMIRYNAAHRGAEREIFPHLAAHDPGLISYTATRWGYLLRRPRGWPKSEPIPTAEMCYRFVLSNNHVDVCLTAPRNEKQLRENLKVFEQGPLSEDEMNYMHRFGDVVHHTGKMYSFEDRRS